MSVKNEIMNWESQDCVQDTITRNRATPTRSPFLLAPKELREDYPNAEERHRKIKICETEKLLATEI